MPRIRTIKPEFWADEKVSPLDPVTRLVFLGLISMADDCGRLVDNLKQIDAFIFPETEDSAREALANLSRISRVRRGVTHSGQKVIQIANWESHQKIDHPNIKAALPEIVEIKEDEPIRESLANDSRITREASRPDLRPTTIDQLPKSLGAKAPKLVDPRHAPVRELIAEYWNRHSSEPMPWDGKTGKKLDTFLRGNPNWKLEGLEKCIRNRELSEDVNHSEMPERWIPNLPNWRNGPLDKFNKPLKANDGTNRQNQPIRVSAATARNERNAEAIANVARKIRLDNPVAPVGGPPVQRGTDGGGHGLLAADPIILPPKGNRDIV
jgi:hypothetical protein